MTTPCQWKPSPGKIKLSSAYIDIWRTRLDISKQQINDYLNVLSPMEKSRVQRYKSLRKQNEFIITRGLLRTIIGNILDINPGEFEFDYTKNDKPFISETKFAIPISFNVSHSHNQSLIALTVNRKIGIDIEMIRHNVNFLGLITRFFSKEETEILIKYNREELPKAFFSCWTRKEAFVKALGDGISFGLADFSVSVDPEQDEILLITHADSSQASDWTLVNIPMDCNYVAALAATGSAFQLRYWQ